MKPSQWRRSALGRFLRHLPRIKHIRGTWLHRRFGDRLFIPEIWQPDRVRFAGGCAVGSFFAMMPLPFQMPAAGLIAFFTRVNLPAAVALTWVSNPFTAPFFIYLQYRLGCLVLGMSPGREPGQSILDLFKHAPLPMLIGAFLTAALLSIITYPLSLWGWDLVTKHFLHPHPRPSPSTNKK